MNLKKIACLTTTILCSYNNAFSAIKPADDITIRKISYNGSGCPQGTVAENISPDKEAFTLTFSEYIAEAAPDILLSDGRKNCQLTIDLDIPQGWQFSIASFDYRGWLSVDRGIQAEHKTSYYFQGSGLTGRFSERIKGPVSKDYQFREAVGIRSEVWSACGVQRALNVNTAISVRNTNKKRYPNSSGVIGTDSVDGQIRQVWGISWRRCR